jgi:apolipoprotein D and lipocalin family protein
MSALVQTGRFDAARRWRIGLAVAALSVVAPAAALTPVADFDLNRYFGAWYEIAAIRGFIQSRCARDTQSEYRPADNGAISTHIRCLRADGSVETSEGQQRLLDPALPSVFKVTTVHFLGIWWYPFGRESIVIAVDPDYRWLVVGHPSLRYGRILAREPLLSGAALQVITGALVKEGFDPCAFAFTPQAGGRAQAARLCDQAH